MVSNSRGRGVYNANQTVGRGGFASNRGRGGGRGCSSGNLYKPYNRRNVFDEYISLESVERGISEKSIHRGVLRINPRRRFDAYVSVEGLEQDVYVQGARLQNRALHGDIVAIELLTGELLEKEQRFRRKRKEVQDKENLERQKMCDLDLEDLILAGETMEDDDDEVEEEGTLIITGGLLFPKVTKP